MLNAGQEDIQKNITQIKNSINDIDTRLRKLESTNKKQQNDVAYSPKPKTNRSNVILPDEAVKAPPKKKYNSPRTNSIPQKEEVDAQQEAIPEKNPPAEVAPKLTNEHLKNEIDAVKAVVDKRDYGEAIRKLTKMIEEVKDPVSLNVCNFYLGESHYGLKQYSKAIDYYEKVLNYGKTDKTDDALIGIAEAKFRLGNISEAKEAYQKFMKSFPKSEHTPTARKMLQQI
jgi:TolA-binding protein